MSYRSPSRRLRGVAALGGSFMGALIAASLAFAGFASTSTATHTVQTKRIFVGARTAGAHGLTDASSGAGSVKDDPLSYADAIVNATGSWATAFSTTRFLKFTPMNQLPAGVTVSSVTFDFRMIGNTAGDTACYYFEVHRVSDGSQIGSTHFSSASPQCTSATTYTTVSTSLPEVTTSDIANDMYVKVFGRESGARPMKIDLATVTLTLYGQTITLHNKAYTDQSTGTAANGPILGLDVAGDGITYTNTTSWPTAYSTTKYLQLRLPVIVPAGSTITNVAFNRTWHSAGTLTSVCYYIEVYSGATLLGSHGSANQISCSSSTSTWNTDSTTLPEVASATDVNQLFIRIYGKASVTQKSVDDLDSVTVTYYLD
jgi:hypothetical protein